MEVHQLRSEVKNLLKQQQGQFEAIKQLPHSELKIKPAPDKWSVIQCIEHLNLAFDYYLPAIEKKMETTPKGETNNNIKIAFFTNMMINGLRPTNSGEIKKKMKTFKRTTPREDLNVEQVFFKFESYFKKMETLFSSISDAQLKKVKVNSLIGPALRFKLGECFLFLAVHQERHFKQIEHVLAAISPTSKQEIA